MPSDRTFQSRDRQFRVFTGFKTPRPRSVTRYGDRPRANILRRFLVCIALVAALLTTEVQPSPVGCRDITAGVTPPACVAGTDLLHGDSDSCGLVFDLESHIGVGPSVNFGSEVFPLLERTVSNIRQVLYYDLPCPDFNRVADQCLTCLVEQVRGYWLDFPLAQCEPTQMVRKITGVYCWRNLVNGKVYVGQSVSVLARKQAHNSMLRRGVHFNKHLQSSWDKYGKDSFTWELLVECAEDELDAQECYFLEKLNALDADKGYNHWSGGHTNRRHSDETKRKISEANRRRVWTQAQKDAQSLRASGHVVSEEARRKMREAATGRHHSKSACEKMSRDRTGRAWTWARRKHANEKNEQKWKVISHLFDAQDQVSSGEISRAAGWTLSSASKLVQGWVKADRIRLLNPETGCKGRLYGRA